jgi:histidinol-phosphatase (PHP family)
MGGGFVLSDDSHAVEQIGLNYPRVWKAMAKAGIAKLFYCQPTDEAEMEAGFEAARFEPINISELTGHGLTDGSCPDEGTGR